MPLEALHSSLPRRANALKSCGVRVGFVKSTLESACEFKDFVVDQRERDIPLLHCLCGPWERQCQKDGLSFLRQD